MKSNACPWVRALSGGRICALAAMLVFSACTADRRAPAPEPGPHRPVAIDALRSPSGIAVCYGPFREGQGPYGPQPTPDQLLEDLRIIERHWNTIRTYAARGTTETVLRLIDEHDLNIRVIVGAWIATETVRDADGAIVESRPDAILANREEVAAAIRLANAHPDIVAAVAVGNETQVSWTAHRVHTDTLIDHIRAVRGAVDAPVTTADDFGFWVLPESRRVAAEIDFIITHAYAMWNGTQLDEAIAFTDEKIRAVRDAHPDRLVVLGETGWATRVHTEGEQARLIKGRPGEAEQAEFYDAIRRWAARERTIVFFFEAFDEPWKGGAHPNEVEKHWGLFRVDRTPKRALAQPASND